LASRAARSRGGGNPTIKLEGAGTNKFTLTLSGTTWEPAASLFTQSITRQNNYVKTGTGYVLDAPNGVVRTSDTVLIVTIDPNGSSGTWKLKVFEGQEAEWYGTAGGDFQSAVVADRLDVASDSETVDYQP
jgi:hypothetical protein